MFDELGRELKGANQSISNCQTKRNPTSANEVPPVYVLSVLKILTAVLGPHWWKHVT